MEIAVFVKHIHDLSQIKVDALTGEPLTKGVSKRVNDLDRNAIEEAVRTKERAGGRVVAICVGEEDARAGLREALAMGCDAATLVVAPPGARLSKLQLAKALAGALRRAGTFDLVLAGAASADDYFAVTAAMAGALLGLPVATFASKIEIRGGSLIAERNFRDYVEVAEAPLPALVTVAAGINEPRIPTLRAILAASRKEIRVISLRELETGEPGVVLEGYVAPRRERKKILISGDPPDAARSLVEELLREGLIGRWVA